MINAPSTSTLYFPPPYTKPNNDPSNNQMAGPSTIDIEPGNTLQINNKQHQNKRTHHRHHQHRKCKICGNRNTPSSERGIGPYLIHRTQPDLVFICPCLNRAHPICLKKYGSDYSCSMCNYIYQSRWYIYFFSQLLCLVCHLLSLASAIGLVFGLSNLGRALDEIGLGSEMGPKLDGDETWQDHEMAQIVEWLNIVHFATGLAGEALLGLVYIVGVCLVIGLDRTLIMISNILYIQLDYLKLKQAPKWVGQICIYVCLFILGLVLGTYLLFFSWIWASVLHHIRKRVLDVRVKKHHDYYHDKNKLSTSIPQSTLTLSSV